MNRTAPSGPHVLIVDDEPDHHRPLLALFSQAGMRISLAFDGMQAYQRTLASEPDVILMDVRMPTLDGFGACRLMKSNPAIAAIPILFLGSDGNLKERLHALRNGGADYIAKPYAPEEVLARIRIHLRARHGTTGDADTAPLSAAAVLVRAAQQYLVANLANAHSLAGIAGEIGTHEKTLSRAFRAHAGMSVFEFVRQERLRVARRLLTDTALTVTAIAEEVGFSSAANFGTAFREQTGMTPTAFRAALREGGVAATAAGMQADRSTTAVAPSRQEDDEPQFA